MSKIYFRDRIEFGASWARTAYVPSTRQLASFEPRTLIQINTDIAHYWGSTLNERFYTISENELTFLHQPTGRVAIEIENLLHPETVTVRWISFPGTSNLTPSSTKTYFVLDFDFSKWFELETNAIAARIAKTQDGQYYIYFHRVRVGFKKEGGTAGDNMATGAKIPSHSN